MLLASLKAAPSARGFAKQAVLPIVLQQVQPVQVPSNPAPYGARMGQASEVGGMQDVKGLGSQDDLIDVAAGMPSEPAND